MSKQQSLRRCWKCGPVSLSHRCESDTRPQSKMRGPVAGLTTGPAWSSEQWASHLRAKVETVAKASAGTDVRVGDVWASAFEYRVTQISSDGKIVYSTGPSGAHYSGTIEEFVCGRLLISRRAQKPDEKVGREPGEFRKGDRVRFKFDRQLTGTVVDLGTRGHVLGNSTVWHTVDQWRGSDEPDGAYYTTTDQLELVEPAPCRK